MATAGNLSKTSFFFKSPKTHLCSCAQEKIGYLINAIFTQINNVYYIQQTLIIFFLTKMGDIITASVTEAALHILPFHAPCFGQLKGSQSAGSLL